MPISAFKPLNSHERQVLALEKEFLAWQKKWVALHQSRPEERVKDYLLHTWNGQMKLSEAFGQHEEMILIHNMGKACRYCTLWADGINGQLEHFESRAALAVLSPDPTDIQKEFAMTRNWNFTMLSGAGSRIISELGFRDPSSKRALPGISILVKKEGKLFRKTRAGFGPGDLYCHLWHYFALLPSASTAEWSPQFMYLK